MRLVLDTSVSLAWLRPDGTAKQIALADLVLDHMESMGNILSVPNLWWLEWATADSALRQAAIAMGINIF